MITDTMNLNDIAREVHQNAVNKGFHDADESEGVFLANQCNNIHSETSELWDSYRSHKLWELCDKAEKMKELGLVPLSCAAEELADLVIRALDVGERLGIDMLEAVMTKHEYNKTRPYKHGKRN